MLKDYCSSPIERTDQPEVFERRPAVRPGRNWFSTPDIRLPPPQDEETHHFLALKKAIRKGRFLLTLGQNWDDEGSPGYSHETFRRVEGFLVTQFERLKNRGRMMRLPSIQPGPDGSIDLHWKFVDWELLVNVPSDPGSPLNYYGDDYKQTTMKGTFPDDNICILLAFHAM